MNYGYQSVAEALKSRLAEKISRNPSYSLRAFAKTLELAPSTLSEILSGKKSLSNEKAYDVAQRLGMVSEEAEYFVKLLELSKSKTVSSREAIQKRLHELNRDYQQRDLSVDLFRVIADWYHFPILEMTDLSGFKLTAQAAAKKLGITKIEAEAAIDRLLRLELLERNPKGALIKPKDHWTAQSPVPHEGIRRFNQQMLQKISESLETQHTSERINATETFAGSPAQLEEARELTEDYIQKLLKVFSKNEKKTQIYHLGVHLVNLTLEGVKK